RQGRGGRRIGYCSAHSDKEPLMDVTPASPGCLSGIRVLDLTQFEAGTTCTDALAWVGADIAKVEPQRGEAGRTGFGAAYSFMMYNANQRSITANRKPEPGPTIGDTGTGMLMAFSIVSALFDRARTGKGRRLQVAMQDSVMHYSRGMFITHARTGQAAPRRLPSSNPPGGIYPCKPGGPND